MKIHEILGESGLTFFGSPCTKDCSGHRAGYEWAKRKGAVTRPNSSSNSFNNGAEIRIKHHNAGLNPISTGIRGGKGRYQKFQPKK